MPGNDYYDVLGLQRDASAHDIRMAWRSFVLENHPDRNPGSDEEKFKLGATAYAVLSDPEKRRRYDTTGKVGPDDLTVTEEQIVSMLSKVLDFAEILSQLYENPPGRPQGRPSARRKPKKPAPKPAQSQCKMCFGTGYIISGALRLKCFGCKS